MFSIVAMFYSNRGELRRRAIWSAGFRTKYGSVVSGRFAACAELRYCIHDRGACRCEKKFPVIFPVSREKGAGDLQPIIVPGQEPIRSRQGAY